MTVETAPGTGYRRPAAAGRSRPTPCPEPADRVGLERPYHVYLPGVGGTGVITLNALLSWAALIDGLRVLSYDQTGAAQKWGPVLSSLILARPEQVVAANKVGLGQADLYLALDLLAAGTRVNLERCDPARTVAVVNASLLPSGEMVRNVDFTPPVDADPRPRSTASRAPDAQRRRRRAAAGRGRCSATTWRPTCSSLGVAYQAGLLPLTGAAIEQADPPERRRRGPEPPGLPLRPALGGRPGPGPGARRASGARRSRRSGRAALERLGGRDASAYVVAARPLRASRPGGAPAAGAPRRRAGRLPGRRATRRAYVDVRPRRWPRARPRARPGGTT